MSLWAKLDATIEANPGLDNTAIAEKFLRRVPRAELVALVAEEVQHRRRSLVRAVEMAVIHKCEPPTGLRTRRQRDKEYKTLLPLLEKRFPVLTGEERQLQYLKREQLQKRIEMLKGQEEGVRRAREVTERILSLCEAAGVDCLAEMAQAA